jgi:general secretion pathway protein H
MSVAGSDHTQARCDSLSAPSGFTLLELIVVLTIASLLFLLAPPLIEAALPGVQTKSVAIQVAAVLKMARDKALMTQRDMTVTVDVDKGEIISDAEDDVLRVPKVVAVKLLTARSELDSEQRGKIHFFPLGGATGGRITLSRGGHAWAVDVDWLTGRIRVERVDG